MRRDDVRFAAAARDDGLRKVSKYTWRAGAAGVVCSALLAVAFGHHVATQPPAAAHTSGGSGAAGSNTGSGAAGSSNGNGGSGVGGGNSSNGNSGSGSQGQGTIVVPAQPPAPASGGGQVISGAS
jgi:hypothetical protein